MSGFFCGVFLMTLILWVAAWSFHLGMEKAGEDCVRFGAFVINHSDRYECKRVEK